MLALADRLLTDRLVTYLLDGGVEDGGQWDMVGVAYGSFRSPRWKRLSRAQYIENECAS